MSTKKSFGPTDKKVEVQSAVCTRRPLGVGSPLARKVTDRGLFVENCVVEGLLETEGHVWGDRACKRAECEGKER